MACARVRDSRYGSNQPGDHQAEVRGEQYEIKKLTFLGSTSEDGDCPSVYETKTGDLVIQGDLVTDPDVIGQARHVKPQEGFVVVPRELLVRFAPRS